MAESALVAPKSSSHKVPAVIPTVELMTSQKPPDTLLKIVMFIRGGEKNS